MQTSGPGPPSVYAEASEYDTLKAAYEAASTYLDFPPDNSEEWLMNLHNHLVWRSYETGDDPAADTVVLSAIDLVIKRRGISPKDTDPETQRIIDYLTLA